MRIGIIGYGTVGEAVASVHDRTMLMWHDPKFEEWEQWDLEKITKNCGWIYLCLPTPVGEEGHCDTSILVDMFDQLKEFEGFVISKSTAPPKFYSEIIKQTGPTSKYKFRLLHMPVFIRPEHALDDMMNPELIVIGGNPKDVHYAAQFIISSELSHKHKAKVIKTDIGSAAAIKYYVDSFLSNKIIWNTQYAKWCKSQDVDWTVVSEGLKEDKKLGPSHYDLTNSDGDVGYGEKHCVDNINVLLNLALESNIDLSLLKLGSAINTEIREEQAQQRALEEQTRSSLRRRREDRVARAVDRKPRRR